MKQSRVLHVFKYFRPQFAGEGIFLERLAQVFARLRPDVAHEVAVTVTPRPPSIAPPPGLAAVHYLTSPRDKRAATQARQFLWTARNVRRYDAVHYHTHTDRTFLACAALKLSGVRLVLSATLDDSIEGLLRTYRPLFRPLVRRLADLFDCHVAISPKLYKENNRYVRAAKSALIPIGIPIPPAGRGDASALRARLGLPGSATLLLSVGGICARKDQLFLARQLPALLAIDPNLLLVLVGPVLEPDYHASILKFIAGEALDSRVHFAGYSDAPGNYYAAADIMVFASREEGFGTAVIEAMSYGLPVVCRRLPGVNDRFVEHARSGFLFDRDADYLAAAAELVRNPVLRRAIGERGRAFVAEHFDITAIAARYLAIYGFASET